MGLDRISLHVNACALTGRLSPLFCGRIGDSSPDHNPVHLTHNRVRPRHCANRPPTGGESRTCQRRAADLQISAALLDQSVWAGVGNIAKSEILFQTGLDPDTQAEDQPVPPPPFEEADRRS